MMQASENILEALVKALMMEKGTREFYDYAASRTVTDKVRLLFERLRDWEDSHMRYLAHLYQALLGDREMISYEAFLQKVPSEHIESGVPLHEAEEDFRNKEIRDDADALNVALEIEGKAYGLYRRLAETSNETNVQVIFREMMSQEKKHIDHLMGLKKPN